MRTNLLTSVYRSEIRAENLEVIGVRIFARLRDGQKHLKDTKNIKKNYLSHNRPKNLNL